MASMKVLKGTGKAMTKGAIAKTISEGFELKQIVAGQIIASFADLAAEGAGSVGQFVDLVHGLEEDLGSEPESFNHAGVEEEGCGRQVGQDREGLHLAALRQVLVDFRVQSRWAHPGCRPHSPHDQAWLEH